MTSNVIGFVSPENGDYKKHSKVLTACFEAGIDKLPKETAEFFGDEHPCLELLEQKLEFPIQIHAYKADMVDGFEIIVSEIPKNVHKIRFYNSY